MLTEYANYAWKGHWDFDRAEGRREGYDRRECGERQPGLLRCTREGRPPLVIDARMKPGYPEELFCDEDTARRVDERWKEYFPAGDVEMGDSDRGHLD